MKRLLQFSLMLIAFACVFSACSDDDDDDKSVISYSSLPQQSKDFVTTHFPNNTVTIALEVTDAKNINSITNAKYFVYLTDSFEIDFTASGEWAKVDSENDFVELPATVLALLPSSAIEYIRTNYTTAKINSITKLNQTSSRYEVDLSNGADLYFNADGQHIATDH